MAENSEDDPRIAERLHEMLSSIMCPISGCWSLHGAETVVFHDTEADTFVLEVWPVTVEEPIDEQGNGHDEPADLLYELAEFDFLELAKQVPLERFHFSQRDAVFEIGWKEFGRDLELRVHIKPAEPDNDD